MVGEMAIINAREAETVFNVASLLGPAERVSYLDRVCGNELPLRKKVEALLESHDELGLFLPDSPKAFAGTVPMEVTVSEKPGDRIGRYKLLEKIGESDFGVVCFAEQKEAVTMATVPINMLAPVRAVVVRNSRRERPGSQRDESHIRILLTFTYQASDRQNPPRARSASSAAHSIELITL